MCRLSSLSVQFTSELFNSCSLTGWLTCTRTENKRVSCFSSSLPLSLNTIVLACFQACLHVYIIHRYILLSIYIHHIILSPYTYVYTSHVYLCGTLTVLLYIPLRDCICICYVPVRSLIRLVFGCDSCSCNKHNRTHRHTHTTDLPYVCVHLWYDSSTHDNGDV